MKKLYDRSPLGFALMWIGIYVVSLSLADGLSDILGMTKVITAPLCVLFSGVLLVWVNRNSLSSFFGLCRFRGKPADYLYFIPLAMLVSVNLWWGFHSDLKPVEAALYVISMLCVGFLEEIIFRGFLFQAMRKDGLKWAVIVSSVTFGIGHIVNLLSGAPVVATLIQIVYAVAAGFLFTILYYKGGSLLPCIVTHSAINSLSVFANEQDMSLGKRLFSGGFLFVVAVVYSLYILKKTKKTTV